MRLPLRLESRHHLLGVHAQLDHFERHAPPHRLGLLRDIDDAAAAFADPLQQLVTPQRLAHGFVGRISEIELDRGTRGVGLSGQQCFRLLMRGEQRVKALAEGGVGSADGLKKFCPLREGLLGGQCEQRGLTFLGRWHR